MANPQLPRVLRAVQSLTVEPLAVLYYMGLSFLSPTDNALWYLKVCLKLYHDNFICDNLSKNESYAEMEKRVQTQNSEWNFYRTLCHGVPLMLVTFLYGSWSDRFSRRLPMLLSLFGLLINSVLYMLSSILPESSLGFLLLSNFIIGCSGGLLTMLVSTMSYISDISTPESRTTRISILYASSNIGSLIAFTLSGVIFDHSGFIVMYSICISLSLLGIVYTIVRVKDIKQRQDVKSSVDTKEAGKDVNSDPTKKEKWTKYWNISHVKDVVMVTVTKRENNHRAHILAVLTILLLYIFGACQYNLFYINFIMQFTRFLYL